MSEPTRVSLATDDQTKGGSFFDDVDVEVIGSYCEKRKFTKKDGTVVAENVPCHVVKFRPLVEGGEEHDFEEVYSGGAVEIAPDGDGFVGIPGKEAPKGLGESSNDGQFFAELVRAGFPNDRLKGGRVSPIIGLKGHLLSIDPPKKSSKSTSDKKIKVITKIISLPDANAAGPNAAASNANEKIAADFIAAALAKVEKATMNQLSAAANKKFANQPNQLDVVSLLLDSKFLAKQLGWAFNGREVSRAAAEPELVIG